MTVQVGSRKFAGKACRAVENKIELGRILHSEYSKDCEYLAKNTAVNTRLKIKKLLQIYIKSHKKLKYKQFIAIGSEYRSPVFLITTP